MHLGDVRTAASLFDPACTHGDVSNAPACGLRPSPAKPSPPGGRSTVTAPLASVNCAMGDGGREPRPPWERRNALLAAGGARAAADLAHDPARAVDVIERLDEGGACDRHGPVLLRVEPVLAAERLDVAIEDEAHHLELLIEERRSGVPADDVVARRQVERRAQVEPSVVLGDVPALRERERLAAGGALERSAHHGDRVHVVAVLLVTLHGPVAQTEREGRVRIVARAFELEAGLGALSLVALLDRVDLVLVSVANLARGGIDEPGELNHRIVRRLDRCLAALEELLAHGDVLELAAGDELAGELVGRLLPEDLAYQGIVGAEDLAQLGEREAQDLGLVVVVHGRSGEELLLEGR